jgi:hypothetical protein
MNRNHKPQHYRYYDHEVIINRHNFYDGDNYEKVRIKDIGHAAIYTYRVASLMSDTVVKHRGNDRDFFSGNRVNTTHDFRRQNKEIATQRLFPDKDFLSFFSEADELFRKNSQLITRKHLQDIEENRTMSDKIIS